MLGRCVEAPALTVALCAPAGRAEGPADSAGGSHLRQAGPPGRPTAARAVSWALAADASQPTHCAHSMPCPAVRPRPTRTQHLTLSLHPMTAPPPRRPRPVPPPTWPLRPTASMRTTLPRWRCARSTRTSTRTTSGWCTSSRRTSSAASTPSTCAAPRSCPPRRCAPPWTACRLQGAAGRGESSHGAWGLGQHELGRGGLCVGASLVSRRPDGWLAWAQVERICKECLPPQPYMVDIAVMDKVRSKIEGW
jgi:hypothetical protein